MGFNGAMPFQAWIHAHRRGRGVDGGGLQWGHALSGMDTIVRWKPPAGLDLLLQWGHALSGMDTAMHSRPRSGR